MTPSEQTPHKEKTVFLFIYLIGDNEEPIKKRAYESWEMANKAHLRYLKDGIFVWHEDGSRDHYPPHMISRYHLFPGYRITTHEETDTGTPLPEHYWEGYYEDEKGNRVTL
jgi:hypothetical protein